MPPRSRRPVRISRRFAAYALHGHSGLAVVDYAAFLERLSRMPYAARVRTIGDRTVILASIAGLQESMYLLRLVEGRPGEPPLLFDAETGAERFGEVGATEFVASSALVLVNANSRVVVYERRRPGVPVADFERALSQIGRDAGLVNATFSLTPILSEDFLSELDDFERIRRAEVSVVRPNHSWTDSAEQLAELAGQSNASEMEIVATASRGQSLSLSAGIVKDIRDFASRSISAIKDARVFGRRRGTADESTLTFSKHQRRTDVRVDPTLDAPQREEEATAGAVGFLRSLSGNDDE